MGSDDMNFALKLARKFVLVVVLCGPHVARGSVWYASGTGTSTNGTPEAPWSVAFSVGKVANPHLKPGDTVRFQPGSYVCTETNGIYSLGKILEFKISGTSGAPITYESEKLWEFSFDGGLLLPPTTSNLILRNFRIHSSTTTNRVQTHYAQIPPGISHYGNNVKLFHNLVENVGHPGIGSWKTTKGKHIAGNIIRFAGVDDVSSGVATASRGSGMYLQNENNSSEALIEGNICYFNYTTGLKAYGNTDIWKFRFLNQISAYNNEAGVFYHVDKESCNDLEITGSSLWKNGVGIRLGYPLGRGDHSNARIHGNYVVDHNFPFYQINGWSGNRWTENVGVRVDSRYVWYMEKKDEQFGDVASHTIENNQYHAVNVGGVGKDPFGVNDSSRSFDEWRSITGGDLNSKFSYTMPSETVVRAFAPSPDPDFVYVAVFNWASLSSVKVNVDQWFTEGDYLSLMDVQAAPQAYREVVLNGEFVELDLKLMEYVSMKGSFAKRPEGWNGFEEGFRVFVIHRKSRSVRPPENLRAVN
jgi:hypothetical protein